MSMTTAHIINHTHWDREWFLTSEYTSRWIPGLIDKLEQLAAANADFHFLLDGQTLVIEDLLKLEPGYEARIRKLVRSGCLQIGPYYCQPDWQLTSGEMLIRNLAYGQKDLELLGGTMNTGWMVDTFGHISQSPQIHQLFDIDALYVWRGVPELHPYFTWQGADGTRLFTVHVFGGYRNLYGVSHAPEVALRRLEAEMDKLRPFYPTADVPLFDGYDLEDNPEDPAQFYEALGGVRADIALVESTPHAFAVAIREKGLTLPMVSGELNSGKHGATFPGVFSARTYLKIMAHDCERMLLQICEPLAVMASMHGRPFDSDQYEAWSRLLLQNAVHDCICGVSIDQVHEKMAFSYSKAFEAMRRDAMASLEFTLQDFAGGSYAVSTVPYAMDNWHIYGEELVRMQTNGVGIWPVVERVRVTKTDVETDQFYWRNEVYEATVEDSGVVTVDNAVLGVFVVSAELGDTYSDELGEQLGILKPESGLRLEQSSDHHTMLSYTAVWRDEQRMVKADVRLIFDESPLIKWQVDLDSRGTDLRVEMILQTGVGGEIISGMPFDQVKRKKADEDLLPRMLPKDLEKILLGQRELNRVTMFPFHDYVAIGNGEKSVAVLAKGLRAYRTRDDGEILIPLRRAVEWLTAADLQHRVGDAGPFFYVPDARCERVVRHEVAVAFGFGDVSSIPFLAASAAYQNPAILVDHEGNGSRTAWQLLREDAPLGALFIEDGRILARLYNPSSRNLMLSKPYATVNMKGTQRGDTASIAAKQIVTLAVEPYENEILETANGKAPLAAALPEWRVGLNQGKPEAAIMENLADRATQLAVEIAELEEEWTAAEGNKKWHLQHSIYVKQRERLEFELSYLLNQRKQDQNGQLDERYLYRLDTEIAELGLRLNELRIKRRIFDYVVEALPIESADI